MNRSGFSEDGDFDQWAWIRWRGIVTSTLRGRVGQAFLREMIAALDAMPVKRLVPNVLVQPDGEMCALGVVAAARRLDVTNLDPEDYHRIAAALAVSRPLVREIEWLNDSHTYLAETPEARWTRMREWAEMQLIEWEVSE